MSIWLKWEWVQGGSIDWYDKAGIVMVRPTIGGDWEGLGFLVDKGLGTNGFRNFVGNKIRSETNKGKGKGLPDEAYQ